MKGTGFIVTRMITHLLYTYMHVCLINTDVHMNFFNIFYFEPNALNLKNNLSHSSAVPAILIKIRSSIPSLFFYCCCIRICRNHTWGHLLVNFILTNKIVGCIPQLHFFGKLCQYNLWILISTYAPSLARWYWKIQHVPSLRHTTPFFVCNPKLW